MPTRTANFPIGFRRLRSDWNKDLTPLLAWARASGFEAFDLMEGTAADVAAVAAAGLRLGSVDLLEMGKLLVNDAGERRDRVARNVAYVREMATAGVRVFFTVLLPDDFSKKRSESYAMAVETMGPIAEAAAAVGARIAVEGWPGPAPHFPALCCTPESCRAFIRDTNPRSVGINYDPSHLVRLGVDPVRFLEEFVAHVPHVHGKDTELFPEVLYELGLFQGSIDEGRPPHRFGSYAWRYAIPRRGVTPWTRVFEVLRANGYGGAVSVELEDEEFNGTEEGERAGLMRAMEYLRTA
jgi:sugar phosphate isomerase/epimerase